MQLQAIDRRMAGLLPPPLWRSSRLAIDPRSISNLTGQKCHRSARTAGTRLIPLTDYCSLVAGLSLIAALPAKKPNNNRHPGGPPMDSSPNTARVLRRKRSTRTAVRCSSVSHGRLLAEHLSGVIETKEEHERLSSLLIRLTIPPRNLSPAEERIASLLGHLVDSFEERIAPANARRFAPV